MKRHENLNPSKEVAMIRVLILLPLLFSLGCATRGKSLQVEGYPMFTLETLKRNEYQILETTTGKGCVTRILGIIKISQPDSYYVEQRGLGGTSGASGVDSGGFIGGLIGGVVGGLFGDSGWLIGGLVGWFVGSREFFGKSSLDQAREIALYTSLESVPEADFLFEPRYYDEEYGFPLIYSKVCSTVKGKAVRIRPDVIKGP